MPEIKDIHVLKVGDSLSSDGIGKFHTSKDLQELAATYDPSVHEAPVILGHDEDNNWEDLLSSDSDPAWGWVKKVHTKGNNLYVDIDASEELYEFIDKKRYKKRSLAYYSENSKKNPIPGKISIRHLAMLGSAPPAIKGLEDIKLSEEKKMTTKEEAKQLLDEQSQEWLAFILKDNGNIVNENIVGFDPKPSEENNWLYNLEEEKFEGAFLTDQEDRFVFEIKGKGEGEAEEFVVSVKADAPETEEDAEEDIINEVDEVQDSVQESDTPAEEEAKDNLKDQELELKEYDEAERLNNNESNNKEENMKTENKELKLMEDDQLELGEGKDCPNCGATEGGEELGEKINLEEGMSDEEKMKAMEEELEMLRSKVKLQEEREFAEKVEDIVSFSEGIYTSGRILESQIAQEDVKELLTSLVSMNTEHMVYGEGDNQKSVLDTFKTLLSALPEQVKFSEAVATKKAPGTKATVADDVKSSKYSDDSNKLDSAIRSAMKENGYNGDDMNQYRRFYRELNGRV